MTTQRTSVFGFLLKTVLVFAGLVLTAWLVLNLWSRWELKQARNSIEEPTEYQVSEVIAPGPAHSLIAVSKVGEGIEWTKDERITVSTTSSQPCRDWTPEQFKTVQLVVERNTGLNKAVLNALREPPRTQEVTEADHKIILPMINLARLLTADARIALAEGRVEHFLGTLEVLVSLDLECESNPSQTNHILNTSIRNLSNLTLLHGLSRESPDFLETTFLKQCRATLPATQINEALRAALIGDLAMHLGLFHEQCWSSTPDSGMIKTLIHPIVIPIFCGFSEAAMIEQQMVLLDLIDQPFGLHPDAFEQPPRSPIWKVHRIFAEIAIPNLMSTIGRTQAIAAQRQLLDAALAMRTTPWPGGAYPKDRPDIPALTKPDPFSGQILEYQLLDDGRLHLAVANGPELLNALKMSGRHHWLDPVVLGAPATE